MNDIDIIFNQVYWLKEEAEKEKMNGKQYQSVIARGEIIAYQNILNFIMNLKKDK